MFETVVPETVRPRSRRLFYQMLPFSLALHGVAAAALVASSIWNVTFPAQSPKLYAAYQLIATPPPPPPPPPPPARRPEIVPPKVTIKMPDVAPTIIPDFIPEVREEQPVEMPVGDLGGQKGGVEGGIEGGELGGDIGGVATEAPPPPKPPEPEVIVVKRDAPLPMGAISQEFPGYPEFALKRNWEDVLVVRYTIGKDGNVKDVQVIQPPSREEFTREAVGKIRHWRFHPYIGENGEPKEVTHELTVEFKIYRKGRT
jgi:protein TonB